MQIYADRTADSAGRLRRKLIRLSAVYREELAASRTDEETAFWKNRLFSVIALERTTRNIEAQLLTITQDDK